MRIIFICGTLEPGKDGVGDYTRRLCAHIIKSGIQVGMLALNDKFANVSIEEKQYADNEAILCYRIPSTVKPKDKSTLAKSWIEQHNPEWLSLQFVPYAFHNKGLPFGLPKQLKHIGIGKKWHIMFHELWLGLRSTDSIKFKSIGFLQKKIVKTLNRKLKFEVIHTHTKFYLQVLNYMNLNTKYLSIFSNIKFNKNSNVLQDDNSLVFIHFGTIHPNIPIHSFAEEISLYAKQNQNKKIKIVFLGRSGSELDMWVKVFEENQVLFEIKGELSDEEISLELQKANYGITTNPIFVLEKSGTVAAIREHNLPILVVSEDTNPNNGVEIDLQNDFFVYSKGNLSNFIFSNHKKKELNTTGVNQVSKQFLSDLLKIEFLKK